MYSSDMLNSNIYLNPHPNHNFYQTYNSYPTFAPRSLSPPDRYYRALAAARSAELEMLEEGARREEAYLKRRLQDLRKARVERLCQNTPNIPYFGGNASTDNLPYKRNQWETFRLWLQEEERLARLEALYRNLNELERGRPRAVAAGKYSNFRGMPLIEEEVGLLHKLGISREVDTSHRPSFVTNEASVPVTLLGSIPARSFTGDCNTKYSHDQEKPNLLNDLATHLNGERLSSTTLAIDHTEQVPKVPFQHHRSHQSQPPTASAQTDSGIRSQVSVQTQLLSKTDNSEQEKHAKHSSQASQWLDATLRDQLKKRLNAEHENEVRDTIEAVLNSLSDIWPASTRARAPSTSTSRSSIKGKEKAYTPSSESKKLSSSDVAVNAWLRIEEIEKQFNALEEEFMFPNKLDFITPTTAGSISATSRLSFTANNQPIRFFEHSLGQLLIRLDSIESQGNEELRNKRKDVVQKVEHALEDLEQGVEERLKVRLASEPKRRSVTIEDVTSPDEHRGMEAVSTSSWTAEKMDSISGSPHPTPAVVPATAKILSPLSTQNSIEEPTTTPNLIAEESVHQNLDSQEGTTVASRVEEAVPQITPSDAATLKASSHSKCQPGIPLQPGCSGSKEAYILEGRDSNPNNGSVEPFDDSARAQEPFSTESQAAVIVGVPVSADSDAQTQDETHVTERIRLFDEETSDISDVDSTTSDWSEVYVAVAR